MVKIKENYVMSPRERAEYERQDALPRKTSGRVDYYFKPQTKYPPRIYVFMDAELWRSRNRRPMGLQNAFPFLSRPMNQQEIEYHHFDWRLCYHQYEDWDRLIYAEQQEAEELDKESPGTGTDFLQQLETFREKFPLKAQLGGLPPVPPETSPDAETQYLRELIANGESLDAAAISAMLANEQQGEKRPALLIALRELYRQVGLPPDRRSPITEEAIQHKLELQQACSRRNFVRRVFSHNKLFALEEIRLKYPGYTEAMLTADLRRKPGKAKRKKHKPIVDLRRCQMVKLAHRLRYVDLDDREYHDTCNRIVLLQNAHNQRLPIPLTVKLQGDTLVYDFAWRTREGVVKSFVELANRKDMTHEVLQKHYQQMIQSNYSC